MLNKFFNFLKGYVIIEIYGKGAERFINICLRRGIKVWGLEKPEKYVRARVYMRDFNRLRGVRRKTRVKIKIADKISMARLIKRYRKRGIFALCAVLCAAAVHESFNRVWAVEINGIKDADAGTVARLLEENGLYIGASKRDMPPITEIKNNVLAKYGDIAWLWVYMEGSKARVEVSERRIPPETVDKSLVCDIVSLADGVVKKVTVKSGEALVSEGDAVSKGDTLISGRVRAYRDGEEENYIYVHSIGEVLAYTMHFARKEEKLYDEIRTPSGEKKRYVTLEIFGKKYELFREKKTAYKDYDIKTERFEARLPFLGYTGIAASVENHIEVTTGKRPVSEADAVSRARDELEEQIAGELAPFSEKTDETLEYEYADGETIIVKCAMSFIENIGTEEITGSE